MKEDILSSHTICVFSDILYYISIIDNNNFFFQDTMSLSVSEPIFAFLKTNHSFEWNSLYSNFASLNKDYLILITLHMKRKAFSKRKMKNYAIQVNNDILFHDCAQYAMRNLTDYAYALFFYWNSLCIENLMLA